MPAAGQDTPFFIEAPRKRARRAAAGVVFFSPHELESRTPLTKTAFGAPSTPAMLFNQAGMVFQAADPHYGNCFLASNKDYLHIYNSSSSQVRTVIVRSYPEPNFGRVGDVNAQVQPGQFMVFGPIVKLGWMWPDGNIYVDAQTADLMLLPCTYA
jgi:hypothetical protein